MTASGLVAADMQPAQPSSPAEVRAMWIDILLRHEGLRRDALAAEANMAASGGTFGTYLSRLRTNGLIREERGRVHLVEELRNG